MTHMISLKDVHVRLRGHGGVVHILRGVDLDLKSKQSMGLVGPSGSGKSTLLMVLAGLEHATSGSVIVADQDYATMDEDARAQFRRDHIGIIFQSFHLIPTMTAQENIALPLELAHVADASARAAVMLEEVGLAHRQNHYPSELSGGEQQRVAIGRALINAPPLILADEPTGNLDQATGGHVVDLLFRLAKSRGSTLLLITHAPELAAQCDRRVRMQDGCVIAI